MTVFPILYGVLCKRHWKRKSHSKKNIPCTREAEKQWAVSWDTFYWKVRNQSQPSYKITQLWLKETRLAYNRDDLGPRTVEPVGHNSVKKLLSESLIIHRAYNIQVQRMPVTQQTFKASPFLCGSSISCCSWTIILSFRFPPLNMPAPEHLFHYKLSFQSKQ